MERRDRASAAATASHAKHPRVSACGPSSPIPVVGIDDEDKSLRVGEVVPPQRADLPTSLHLS
eukprot:1416887-Rhodomonas_salina.1